MGPLTLARPCKTLMTRRACDAPRLRCQRQAWSGCKLPLPRHAVGWHEMCAGNACNRLLLAAIRRSVACPALQARRTSFPVHLLYGMHAAQLIMRINL